MVPAEAEDITEDIQRVADKLPPLGTISSPAIHHTTTHWADGPERYV